MATYTSTQNGEWNDPATWGGGGWPNANGDQVKIYHTVTYNVDLSAATLSFVAKNSKDDEETITKADGDFDKTSAANGIVTVGLDADDTATAGMYVGELIMSFSASNIDKSPDISILIEEAVL